MVSDLILEEQAAQLIGAAVTAHWMGDMGNGYGGVNVLAVARDVLPPLRKLILAQAAKKPAPTP